ncbi:hypothetical protein FQN57_003147 [Myotisia sp. PD_48]|nr:hypothetical protein FQN57_003147 [Myotisia sp. PD_48]
MSSSSRARTVLLTGSVAVITATGALWGASMKMDQEAKQRVKQEQQATPEEKINALIAVRDRLVVKRNTLEEQIRSIDARQADKLNREQHNQQHHDGNRG